VSAKSGNRRNRQEALALALAAGGSIRAAAAKAKVAERTARYWLAEDGFRARVEQLRAAMIERSLGIMANTTTKAAAVLRKLLESKCEKTRLAAAKEILTLTLAVRQSVTMESRLQALEAKMRGKKP
jgi:hypothetical protein